MSPVLGDVRGAECPGCQTEKDLGESFYEGQEVYCDCGAILHIDSVEAVYTVKLSRIDIPEEETEMEQKMKTTLDVLKLSARVRDALAAANVKTLSDLTSCSRDDLGRKKNLGTKRIREIVEALHRHNLYLRGGEPPARLTPAQYTVVVAQSHKTAGVPNLPVMAYVLPTGNLSATTFQSFRDAAEKGGCAVSMFTVGDSGIEHVKWELEHFSATKVD